MHLTILISWKRYIKWYNFKVRFRDNKKPKLVLQRKYDERRQACFFKKIHF